MIEYKRKDSYTFDDLVEIMSILRAPGGCPWDREQTHKSIRSDFIEETYEAIEGIDKDDPKILREELGDVLLQVVFHTDICRDNGQFNIKDVITDLCNKLIIRHPHVFSEDKSYSNVETSDQVITNWNEIKAQTKGQKTLGDELDGVSKSLPSLMRGEKLAKKLRKADAKHACGEKELTDALKAYSENKTAETLGALLFTVCASADECKLDAEEALYKYNDIITKGKARS